MSFTIYLGLGSNEGPGREILELAVKKIQQLPCVLQVKISSLYETPALLPEGAPADWNKPFLNLALELECTLSARQLLPLLQQLENQAGRIKPSAFWAPRTLDIDIICSSEGPILNPELSLPHTQAHKRAFVLDPLKDLNPWLKLNSAASKQSPAPDFTNTVLDQARRHPQHAPAWMAILNVTPDSFSDGGQFNSLENIEKALKTWDEYPLAYLDVGAESTRPGATVLSWQEEWSRLKPVLDFLKSYYQQRLLGPKISIDTRHAETAQRCLEYPISVINDVSGSGSQNPAMLDLLKNSSVQYVLMHSLGAPAAPQNTLPENSPASASALIKSWFSQEIRLFEKAGINPARLILDPGIGFGKTKHQSLEVLRKLADFQDLALPLLVGHSRKSFLSTFSKEAAPERDWESVGLSLHLARQGVDILRVHEVSAHIRAFQAYNHLNASTAL